MDAHCWYCSCLFPSDLLEEHSCGQHQVECTAGDVYRWDQLQSYSIDLITANRPKTMFLVRLCIDISGFLHPPDKHHVVGLRRQQVFRTNWSAARGGYDTHGNITSKYALSIYKSDRFYDALASVWIALRERLRGHAMAARFAIWPNQIWSIGIETAEDTLMDFLPDIPSVSELLRLIHLRDSMPLPWTPQAMDAFMYSDEPVFYVEFQSGAKFALECQFMPIGPHAVDARLFPMVLTAVYDRILPRTVCDYIDVFHCMTTWGFNAAIGCAPPQPNIQYYMTSASNKIQMMFYVRTCVAIAGTYHTAQYEVDQADAQCMLSDVYEAGWSIGARTELASVFACTKVGQPSQHAHNLAAVWQVLQATQGDIIQEDWCQGQFFSQWPQEELNMLCVQPSQMIVTLFPALADIHSVELEFTELPRRPELQDLIYQQRDMPFALATESPPANATGADTSDWIMRLFDPTRP